MSNPVSHGACGKTWQQSGNATSHCGACHETFVSLRIFEAHRRGDGCVLPGEVIFRKRNLTRRVDGQWYSPAKPQTP